MYTQLKGQILYFRCWFSTSVFSPSVLSTKQGGNAQTVKVSVLACDIYKTLTTCLLASKLPANEPFDPFIAHQRNVATPRRVRVVISSEADASDLHLPPVFFAIVGQRFVAGTDVVFRHQDQHREPVDDDYTARGQETISR